MGKKNKKKDVKERLVQTTGEVDRAFYDLQVADIGRKIIRLSSLTAELEESNNAITLKYKKFDEDKADVISYLRKTLEEKVSENAELIERLIALQEEKASKAKQNRSKYDKLENQYQTTREELNAEIKRITGLLNSVQDFRSQRDELYKKYEDGESKMKSNEIQHKNLLYGIEKKFLIGKQIIKKETEQRVFNMALQLEADNEKRIAPTTKRVIRENASIQNELKIINSTNESLGIMNDNFKKQNIYYRSNCKALIAERDKALNDAYIQRNVIKQLKEEYNKKTHLLKVSNKERKNAVQCGRQLQAILQKEKGLNYKLRTLEQNLHASQCQQKDLENELTTVNNDIKKFRGTIYDAIMSIKTAMNIQSLPATEFVKSCAGENILLNLLQLLKKPEDEAMSIASVPSVQSLSVIYDKGDLGFTPILYDKNHQKVVTEVAIGVSETLEDIKFEGLSSSEIYSTEEASTVEETEEINVCSLEPKFSTALSKISSATYISSTIPFVSDDETFSEASKKTSVSEVQWQQDKYLKEKITEATEEYEEIEEEEELDEHEALLQALATGNNLKID